MAQIRDGCFRVVAVNREDLDLVNLHTSKGKFVTVEREHQDYSEEFSEKIGTVNPGNCIHATIQSEDVYRPDGIWRFLNLECFDATELHALEVDNIPAQDMLLMEGAFENGRSNPEKVKEDGSVIGFKIGIADSRGRTAHGPVVTDYKECYKTLQKYGSPPFEIISITQEGIPLEIRYYIAKKGSEIASTIIESGDYLVGQDR
jgi:hypothetical protein